MLSLIQMITMGIMLHILLKKKQKKKQPAAKKKIEEIKKDSKGMPIRKVKIRPTTKKVAKKPYYREEKSRGVIPLPRGWKIYRLVHASIVEGYLVRNNKGRKIAENRYNSKAFIKRMWKIYKERKKK